MADDIREHIKPLSDEALHYITEVADKWPKSDEGFPQVPTGKSVDDSVAGEINTFVRKANMHLAQLFQTAEDAIAPDGYLTEMPDYQAPHEQKALTGYIGQRMHGKTVNARAFPHRVADLIKVNNVIVGLHATIAKGEADGEDEPPAETASLESRVARIEKHLGLSEE